MEKLEQRKAELEKEFQALTDEQTKLIEEGKVLNKKLSDIRASQLRLQGNFQEVQRLIDEKSKEKKEVKK